MTTATVQDLQRALPELLSRVRAGEPVVLLEDGRPVAELRPVSGPRTASRPFGLAAGAFVVPVDFDAPLPEAVLRDFECR